MNKFLPRCPADLNSKVVREMSENGTNNHIIAKYFSTIANFASINLEHPSFQPMKEPQTPSEQLAARLVLDYLKRMDMKMCLEVVKNALNGLDYEDIEPSIELLVNHISDKNPEIQLICIHAFQDLFTSKQFDFFLSANSILSKVSWYFSS